MSAISKGEEIGPAMQKAFDSAFKTMVEAGEKADEGTKNVISNLIKDIKPISGLERSAIDILKGLEKDEENKRSTERKIESPQSIGTHNLGESFKSGSASIANKGSSGCEKINPTKMYYLNFNLINPYLKYLKAN